ncbi:Centromere-associated protein E [Bienertia sinuspersici]
MEVGILHPQDCLKRNHHHQRTSLISPANKPRRNVNSRCNLKRRNSQSPPPSNGSTNKAQQSRPKSPPVVGPVRFLKRGKKSAFLHLILNRSPNPGPPYPARWLTSFTLDLRLQLHLRQAKFRYRRSSPGETVGLLTEMLIHMKSLVSPEES